MALTTIDYDARARSAGLNVYFIAEGDRDYNIRLQRAVPANPCCNCYSIAKAFTVTAIGMLYDKGLLTPETHVVDVLSDKLPENMDTNWREVTLHNLMLHYVGFDHGMLDIDAEDATKFGSTDYLKVVLSAPLPHKPGTVHQYTDAAYYVLSRVVERLAGMDIAELLRPILMKTMNFKEFAWSVCPEGYSMGATGLYLRTEDVVKLGILYLNGGEWQGTRVISKDWVDIVLKNGYEFKDKGNGWYGKGGMRGQMLTFNPERGLAVAWHGYEKKVPFDVMIHD
ncbi:MAG: beta-lactamase family protein [Clostridia bacterium]|nr:beta-lactamase family protein [Clostridia bacterium]